MKIYEEVPYVFLSYVDTINSFTVLNVVESMYYSFKKSFLTILNDKRDYHDS